VTVGKITFADFQKVVAAACNSNYKIQQAGLSPEEYFIVYKHYPVPQFPKKG
jgi:hypothetical protein